jgi:hypothetical protein
MLLRYSFSRTYLLQNAHITVNQTFVRIRRIPDFHILFLLLGDL